MTRDRVGAAVRVVDRAHFCFDEQGRQLPQTSAPEVIARMLRLLDVRAGARVLEIGTGSGYSTSLLAELTGPRGGVVSIDVDAQLTARARLLLAEKGYTNVFLISANGRHGWPAGAPYDRLIAWCSVTAVPPAWRDQTLPGAILVVPMRHAEQHWISQYHRSDGDALVEDERQAGGFVPLTSAPFRPWERATP